MKHPEHWLHQLFSNQPRNMKNSDLDEFSLDAL